MTEGAVEVVASAINSCNLTLTEKLGGPRQVPDCETVPCCDCKATSSGGPRRDVNGAVPPSLIESLRRVESAALDALH